jgi:predicted O-methyltransferase YrrM
MVFNPQLRPRTNPSLLLQLRDGIYAADLLVTAIARLDFFNRVPAQPFTCRKACEIFSTDQRCTDVMLTYFTALGLLDNNNGFYSVTDSAREYLRRESPFDLAPYFATQSQRPTVSKMLDALTTGKPQSWSAGQDKDAWAEAMRKPEFAEAFTAGMDSRGALFAPAIAENYDFSNHNTILDIGGASGIYAASIVSLFSHLKGGILEKSPVHRIAQRSLENKGLADCIEVIEGDMFKMIPEGFDVHLFSHVFHDWNEGRVKQLLTNSFTSINAGGSIIVHDAHVNPEKNGPLPVAEYSVLLMFSTEGKCYSLSELAPLMYEAGFTAVEERSGMVNRSIIVARK